MAEGVSSVLNKIAERHLECPICHETYDRPKALDCMHSFCTSCLQALRRSNLDLYALASPTRSFGTITCPVCRRVTTLTREGIDDLKTNFPLISLVDYITREETAHEQWVSEGHELCESCDEGKGACFQCFDCPMYLCKTCRVVHQRVQVLSAHVVVSLEEVNSGMYGPSCEQHPKERKRFYCATCRQVVCKRCFSESENSCASRQHDREHIGDAATAQRDTLQKLACNLQRTITQLDAELAAKNKQLLDAKRKNCQVAAEISAQARRIHDKVTAAESLLLEELTRANQLEAQTFNEREAEVKAVTEDIQLAIDTASDAADTSSNGDFLSVCSFLIEDLEGFSSQILPTVDMDFKFVEFCPEPSAPDIVIGRLDWSSAWTWEPYLHFGNEGCLKMDFGWARDIATHSSGGLAVADCEKRTLVLLSPLGNCKEHLKLDDYPNNVATSGDKIVVVGRARAVKVYINSKRVLHFQTALPQGADPASPVDLQSVALTPTGNVLVGDVRQNIVTEHKATDGSLTAVTPVPVKPNFIAMDARERLYVSDWDMGQVRAVDRGSGDTVLTIRPSIGALKISCRGVCVSGTGTIFVAVVGHVEDTGHIHTYDPDGMFLGCIVKTLRNPYGIALTSEGRLAVADWDSVKMFQG